MYEYLPANGDTSKVHGWMDDTDYRMRPQGELSSCCIQYMRPMWLGLRHFAALMGFRNGGGLASSVWRIAMLADSRLCIFLRIPGDNCWIRQCTSPALTDPNLTNSLPYELIIWRKCWQFLSELFSTCQTALSAFTVSTPCLSFRIDSPSYMSIHFLAIKCLSTSLQRWGCPSNIQQIPATCCDWFSMWITQHPSHQWQDCRHPWPVDLNGFHFNQLSDRKSRNELKANGLHGFGWVWWA